MEPKTEKTIQPQLGIDFDGTICDHAFPGIGTVKRGAKEAISGFRRMGYRILIYSCRTSHWHYDVFGGDPSQPTLERDKVKEMIAFLDEHGIEYDEIDDGSRGKPLCAAYIDDRGLRFEDSWPKIAAWIHTRRPQ